MIEILIAAGAFTGLGALVLLTLISPLTLAWISVGLTVGGVLLGVPAGLYYHLVLRRELLARGPLPDGWYWHPNRFHERLTEAARSRVVPWFWVGGTGFGLTVLGFLIGLVMILETR